MIKKTLNIFVVPNPSVVYDGCSGNGAAFGPTPLSYRDFGNNLEKCAKFGMDVYFNENIDLSTQWIQVWVHDEEEDNLTDHGAWPEHWLYQIADRAPDMIPESVARKIASGNYKSVIRYDRDGRKLAEPIEVTWVPTQETTRYRSWGTFEKAVDYVIRKSKEYEDPEVKAAYEEYKRLLAKANSREEAVA